MSCSGHEEVPQSIWMRVLSLEGSRHSPDQTFSEEASPEIGTVVLESGL